MEYDKLVSQEVINKTITSLKDNGFNVEFVNSKEDALQQIKTIIPQQSSVMNGSSTTLQEIGYIDYLKSGDHNWINLHEAILQEADTEKQNLLRRQSVVSDFYLGSAHAVTESGEIIIASNTGSQLPHLAFTSPNIILVVGAQKITQNLTDAFARLQSHVIPLEDKRMQAAYGFGTTWAKTLILHKENPFFGRKITVLIVNQVLGF